MLQHWTIVIFQTVTCMFPLPPVELLVVFFFGGGCCDNKNRGKARFCNDYNEQLG